MLLGLSTFVIVLIAIGIAQRKNTKVHYPIMVTAFLLDLGMVLYIEITREAIKTVGSSVSGFVWFHATISTIVLVLYIVQFCIGRSIMKGNVVKKSTHRNIGILFVVLRLTNYFTSMFMGS